MCTNYNGAFTKCLTSKNTVEASENRISTDTLAEKDFALETAFRGFSQVPHVVVSRIDIKPFLHNQKRSRSPNNDNVKKETLHLQRLSQKCLVKVVRDDLDKLKDALSVSSATSAYSSDSDSSNFDPVTMAHLKCKICDKQYSSEKKLQNHQENKHMIVYAPKVMKQQKRVSFSDHIIIHEVTEYHKCRKCTKIFKNYKSLKIHMKQYHKKRNCYICHYCNKNFADRMFFKVHIKLHCDVCSQLLPTKAKYLEHRRNVCRVLKLHKCKTCNEAYFKFMDLKDHSYDHISTYFICDICKDQFSTKCAVSHHISYLHSNKQPIGLYSMRNKRSKSLYLCNFCDETSDDHNLIERHTKMLPDLTNMAMTGYKDYYFCDQCLRKFPTETDMLQHKWTHFLKTSDNSQVRPKGILRKKKHNIKTTYKCNEKIPDYLKPSLVLEKLNIEEIKRIKLAKKVEINSQGKEKIKCLGNNKDAEKVLTESLDLNCVMSWDMSNDTKKKALVDAKSKKTLISNFQCQQCGKYYSSNYCLSRHVETQHGDYVNLRCHVCEETFVWPSLLRSHKCIRLNIPEMPFDDARPEIHFDNLHEITQNGFHISDSDDYMHSVDFEIPAPICELGECTEFQVNNISGSERLNVDKTSVPSLGIGYKLIMQEVPIEF